MESSQRNGVAIRKRIDAHVVTLITSFENLLEEAMTSSRDGRLDLLASMDRGLQTDLMVQTMIRATEDLAVLIRSMEELWIFGTLDTRHEDRQPEEMFDLINKLMEGRSKPIEK